VAWTAADRDVQHRRPKAFGWPGEGPSISPAEGQGGAPLAYLLRCQNATWEVLAASPHRAWIRIRGDFPLVDYEEGAWISDAMTKREEKQERAAREAARAARLPYDWPLLYREGVNEKVQRGFTVEDAHRMEAWAWGPGWVRQPGDEAYYGTQGCTECTRDARCTMCAYAASRGTSAERMVAVDAAWIEAQSAEPWGDRAWEVRQMVRFGLLDQAADPDATAHAASTNSERGGGEPEAGERAGTEQSGQVGPAVRRASEGAGHRDMDTAMTDAAGATSGDDGVVVTSRRCHESTILMDDEWTMLMRQDEVGSD
jgi:hypothetical protein